MTVETEVANLTTAVDNLTAAVNVKKQTLDTAVSNAQTAVTDATSQVSLAAAEKTGAQTARDEAETHKNQAYTYSQSAASAVAYQDLTAIAQTKAESAVDVFVYDTSKDSDGGAWRHRTQNTSWYNEPLNTSTRGSRKEFPAVAVIVAETNKVTIYDGDDPSLPMWMVFNGNHMLQSSGTYPAKSVTALNGKVIKASTLYGIAVCDFVKDTGDRYWNSSSRRTSTSPVSGRNTGTSHVDSTVQNIVNSYVNDVAMTVLPDAPIDPATGLPIPTIAVATDGGVSVIKDDGTVVDITNSDSNTALSVKFLSGNKIACHLYTYKRGVTIFTIPEEDIVRGVHYTKGIAEEWYEGFLNTTGSQVGDLKLIPSNFNNYALKTYFAEQENTLSVANIVGLNTIKRNLETPTEGMIAHTTSTYNTGWMNGDIKLATLSDTDDTDLVGSELVTNGTFDTDTSGWTSLSGTNVYDNGTINIQPTDYTGVYQEIAVTAGLTYTVSVEVTATTSGSGRLYIGNAVSNKGYYSNTAGLEVGTHSRTFTANGGNLFIGLATTEQTGANVNFDNISVRLAEPDRSVNNNGLQVFGTVQKSPVATGADLVAYSGFSASNYLEQPYNSDLDFGTGDFCIMGWLELNSTGYGGFVQFSSEKTASGDAGFTVYYTPTHIKGFVGGTSSATEIARPTTGVWHHICFTRKSGVAYLYQNGSLLNSVPNTNSASPTDNTANLLVAGYYQAGNPIVSAPNDRFALLRISGTAPTAEQIKKIYEDEKVLFQDNAKATLHGTSDAVTALAYDDTTELLHVGTSAGRSVFQGLRRVDNTTDAVGVAISASNGLVVEE
jgi:trimeric autotransporter adhesin